MHLYSVVAVSLLLQPRDMTFREFRILQLFVVVVALIK